MTDSNVATDPDVATVPNAATGPDVVTDSTVRTDPNVATATEHMPGPPRSPGDSRFGLSGAFGRAALFALFLFGLSLSLRLPDLDVFLTPDETRWACRSANFWNALSEGRFADTYQKEHPGVITMWLGGLGQTIDPGADWAVACRDIPASELVELAPRPALDAIRDRLFAGRARIAIFVSAGVSAIFLLAIGLVGMRAALLGGVLLATEPFLIALGRVLHLDAVTATLMTLALLALLRARSTIDVGAHPSIEGNGRERKSSAWLGLAAAGAVAGMAALNKSPGLFLGPMAGLIFLVDALRAHASAITMRGPGSSTGRSPWLALVLDTARSLLFWSMGAVAAYFALWPAMWVAPFQSLSGVLLGATDYASQGHEGFNYFLGQPTLDPGPLFYPVAWFVRATPIGVIGLALAVWWALRSARPDGREASRDREAVGWLIIFAILFGVFMSLGAKKFDRYLLPSLPAVSLVAGWGWAGAVTWIGRAWRRRRDAERSSGDREAEWSGGSRNAERLVGDRDTARSSRDRTAEASGADRDTANGPTFWVATALLTLVMLAIALPLRPYFYQYFNPLAGGQQAAPGTLLVGWGEGIDGAARWLNDQPDPETLEVATRYRSAFGPLFRGSALEMNKIDPATVDYYLFYLNQIQRHLDPELMERHFPDVDWSRPFDDLWRENAITPGAERPVEVVRIDGIDYAWLFENDTWREAGAFIDERSDPAADAILVRSDSRFARMYTGPLPLITLDPDATEADVIDTLKSAFASHQAVWLVRYDEIAPKPALARLDYEIGTQTFNTARIDLTELRVTRHQTFPDATASTRPDFGAAPRFEALPGEVRFGDALALDRIAQTADSLYWGRDMGLTLEWSAERDLDVNYTAFLHLIGPDGRRWAHEDRMIGDTDLVPTERWAPSESKHDARTLRIPPGTPPGEYRLHLGVYDGTTGERLPVTLDGEPQPDDVYEMSIEVGRSPAQPDVEALELDHVAAPNAADPEEGVRVTRDVAWVGFNAPEGVHSGRTAALGLVWRVPEGPPPKPPDFRVRVSIEDSRGRTVGDGSFDLIPGVPMDDRQPWDMLGSVRDIHDPQVGDENIELDPGIGDDDRRPSNVIRAVYEVAIDPRARAGEGSFNITLLQRDPMVHYRSFIEPGPDFGYDPIYPPLVAPILINGPQRRFGPPAPDDLGSALDFRFGEVAHLRGASIPSEIKLFHDATAAVIIPRIWWESLGEPDVAYTRFVHLVDSDGAIRAQIDGPPGTSEHDRPTTSWLLGEYVQDAPAFALAADITPGRYSLAVGLYDPDSGERVPVFDADGERQADDRVVVGEVRIR